MGSSAGMIASDVQPAPLPLIPVARRAARTTRGPHPRFWRAAASVLSRRDLGRRTNSIIRPTRCRRFEMQSNAVWTYKIPSLGCTGCRRLQMQSNAVWMYEIPSLGCTGCRRLGS